MEIIPTNTNTTSTPNKKSPDADSETPTRVQPIKPFSSSNGVLKRHNPHHNLTIAVKPVVVSYKECLKNHAATLGSHALDGCGEFMPSPTATQTDPTSLKCAACGCHRNFHRREPEDPFPTNNPITQLIEYKPHHRHHPPPPPHGNRSPNSASPPPISSSYYPSSAPHMLLALSSGLLAPQDNHNNSSHHLASAGAAITTRKRFRTKFSQNQKEKMCQFADRVGWKIQKKDEEIINEFCNEIGVDKGVLKVWMHNNKSTFSKKDFNGGTTGMNLILDQIHNNDNSNGHGNGNNAQNDDEHHERGHEATNGSSSSS